MNRKIQLNKPFLVFIIFIALFSAIFLSSVFAYTNKQLDREYMEWQRKISIISDIRSENIKKWFEQKKSAINAISENLTVKMYLNEYPENQDSLSDDAIIQQEFLNSYLISEAQKSGFNSSLNQKNNIKANTNKISDAALAVISREGKILFSIDYESNLQKILEAKISKIIESKNNYSEIISENKNRLFIYAKPILGLQSSEIFGYAVGIKSIDREFSDSLNFPPETYKTSVTQLVIKTDTSFSIAASNPKIAIDSINISEKSEAPEIKAINNPNKILTVTDAESNALIIAKQIADENWFLIYKISEKEAFGDAINLKNAIDVSAILTLLGLVLALVLIWRHSSSIKYKKLSRNFEKSNKLLSLVTENQVQKMFIIDKKNILQFANDKFAKSFKIKDLSSLKGKILENVLGKKKAEEYTDIIADIKAGTAHLITSKKAIENDKESYFQTKFIPVSKIPQDDETYASGTLIVENDITSLVEESNKKEKNLNEIVKALIKIIEQRSVYFHSHSDKVTNLSVEIAKKLNLEERQIKALSIAASLSNLCLALMPREILNKETRLTEDEQKLIDECPAKTIDLLKGIEFDGPVIEIITQMKERFDGNGPLKMQVNQIILAANILHVANDYIAMTSPRAYRDKLSKEVALEEILKARNTKYFENIVYSLASCVTAHE